VREQGACEGRSVTHGRVGFLCSGGAALVRAHLAITGVKVVRRLAVWILRVPMDV
jgi:hypothetical protein